MTNNKDKNPWGRSGNDDNRSGPWGSGPSGRGSGSQGGGSEPPDIDEMLRRAYALGGMVDQYLSALFVTEDPWIAAISQDQDDVISTLTNIWMKGMKE